MENIFCVVQDLCISVFIYLSSFLALYHNYHINESMIASPVAVVQLTVIILRLSLVQLKFSLFNSFGRYVPLQMVY